jgi:hypothetical protein
MGIAAPRYSPYARPTRGRGRGRGRGGFTAPMRLDNRTRGLLLTGQALDSDDTFKAIREYYEGTGGVINKVNEGVKVEYPNRDMAEKVSPEM